jgi:hypothetical protein
MTAPVSRAVMSLAVRCMGENRREWALAMQAEFEVATAQGEPFAFAAGCLIAAWCEMPKHAEGRLVLANYALALGLLIPMAVFQFASAIGFSSILIGGGTDATLLAGASPNPYAAYMQLNAAPCLLVLWLLLSIGHLRLAWALVDRDWSRVLKVSALIGATMVTLLIVMGVLLLDVTFLISQVPALAIELAGLLAAHRWHARIFPSAAPEMTAA